MAMILTEGARARIISIGKSRAPREACGILVDRPPPDTEPLVIEIPNASPTPEHSFAFSGDEVKEIFDTLLIEPEEGTVFVWHTHPSGSSAPSKVDLQERVPGLKYIVATLNGEFQRY